MNHLLIAALEKITANTLSKEAFNWVERWMDGFAKDLTDTIVKELQNTIPSEPEYYLYRGLLFGRDPSSTYKRLGINDDIDEGSTFTYKQTRASSWTTDEDIARRFAEPEGLLLGVSVTSKNILLDVDKFYNYAVENDLEIDNAIDEHVEEREVILLAGEYKVELLEKLDEPN